MFMNFMDLGSLIFKIFYFIERVISKLVGNALCLMNN